MEIKRNKPDVPVAPTLFVDNVEPGQPFRIGKKLYVRTDDLEKSLRVTSGKLEDVDPTDTCTLVKGVFVYE